MSSSAGYTALTPETTTFPPRYITAPVPDESEAIQRHTINETNFPVSETVSDAVLKYWSGLRGFVDNNAGLLLVALAQLFFAFVNVSIKVLKETDNPIATLQVRPGQGSQMS